MGLPSEQSGTQKCSGSTSPWKGPKSNKAGGSKPSMYSPHRGAIIWKRVSGGNCKARGAIIIAVSRPATRPRSRRFYPPSACYVLQRYTQIWKVS